MIHKPLFHSLLQDNACSSKPNLHFQCAVTGGLQEASEAYLVGLCEETNLYVICVKV